MPLSREDWHQRYLVQARWTAGLRRYFFDLVKGETIQSVLEIGCGTGALLPDLNAITPGQVFGGDINQEYLRLARDICPDCSLAAGNVNQLPFADHSFDLVLCHYFLMWTADPARALSEMRRVTRSGGKVAAFAEPDYGGRIDHPPHFTRIRELQIAGLEEAGADPLLGRKLAGLFRTSGLADLECGVYQGSFSGEHSPSEVDSEWMVLAEDLKGALTPSELEDLRQEDLSARQEGTRLVYVPTFYAWGTVPG
jgi:SAM-dependent methyltransferase